MGLGGGVGTEGSRTLGLDLCLVFWDGGDGGVSAETALVSRPDDADEDERSEENQSGAQNAEENSGADVAKKYLDDARSEIPAVGIGSQHGCEKGKRAPRHEEQTCPLKLHCEVLQSPGFTGGQAGAIRQMCCAAGSLPNRTMEYNAGRRR